MARGHPALPEAGGATVIPLKEGKNLSVSFDAKAYEPDHRRAALSPMQTITSLSSGAWRRKLIFVSGSVQRRVFIWASVLEMESTFPPVETVEGSALGSAAQYWASAPFTVTVSGVPAGTAWGAKE